MSVPWIEHYHRPPDVDAAWELVRTGGDAVRILAGGTDLALSCPPTVTTLVDLADTGLDTIEVGDDAVTIGAMVTFSELLEHPAVAGLAGGVLPEMLRQLGSMLHRNAATIGGHLGRARLSDVIPVLIALDATTVVVTEAGADELPVERYLDGAASPLLITHVRVPVPGSGTAAAFWRASRTEYDHAILNACCRVSTGGGRGDAVAAARVVVGQTARVGRRITAAEEALTGRPLTSDTIAQAAAAVTAGFEAVGDRVSSAGYRRHLAGVAVTRCLEATAGRLPGGGA